MPVPDSPSKSTVSAVGATRSTRKNSARMATLLPIASPKRSFAERRTTEGGPDTCATRRELPIVTGVSGGR